MKKQLILALGIMSLSTLSFGGVTQYFYCPQFYQCPYIASPCNPSNNQTYWSLIAEDDSFVGKNVFRGIEYESVTSIGCWYRNTSSNQIVDAELDDEIPDQPAFLPATTATGNKWIKTGQWSYTCGNGGYSKGVLKAAAYTAHDCPFVIMPTPPYHNGY